MRLILILLTLIWFACNDIGVNSTNELDVSYLSLENLNHELSDSLNQNDTIVLTINYNIATRDYSEAETYNILTYFRVTKSSLYQCSNVETVTNRTGTVTLTTYMSNFDSTFMSEYAIDSISNPPEFRVEMRTSGNTAIGVLSVIFEHYNLTSGSNRGHNL